MVQKPRKITFFCPEIFLFFPKEGPHKKLHNYMSFSLIFHFYTAIQVYSCIFLSDLVYSWLILFILVYSCPVTVNFFKNKKLPYVQVTQLPKLNCWQVCWQSQEKNRRHIFWPAQSAALWLECQNFVWKLGIITDLKL